MLHLVTSIPRRSFSSSVLVAAKRNWFDDLADKLHFRRVVLYNHQYLRRERELLKKHPRLRPEHADIKWHTYGQRKPEVFHQTDSEDIPELIPDMIVPDLKGFELKPYVSYRTKEIYQDEFTAQDLFNVTYGKKMLQDFKEGKLDDEGNSLEPSEEEKQTADEAFVKARQTGSDIFMGGAPKSKKYNIRWSYENENIKVS